MITREFGKDTGQSNQKLIIRILMVLIGYHFYSFALVCSDPWSFLPRLPLVVRIYGDHHLYKWQVEQAGLL